MDLCPGYHSLVGLRLGLCSSCERHTKGKARLIPPATYDGKRWLCDMRVYAGDGLGNSKLHASTVDLSAR